MAGLRIGQPRCLGRDGHRSRNVRSPSATDQVLRAALPKGPSSHLTVAQRGCRRVWKRGVERGVGVVRHGTGDFVCTTQRGKGKEAADGSGCNQ